jgi:hypothetical protein
MFPVDVQGTTTQALVAWSAAIPAMFSGMAQTLGAHWQLMLFGLATDFLLIVGFVWLLERSDNRVGKQTNIPVSREKSLPRRVFDRASQPFVMLGLWMATGVIFTIGLLFVIIGLVLPFSKVASDQAKHEIAINFADRPMMHVKLPDGETMMREISCGPQFCAFWDAGKNGHAALIPVTAVLWGEAPSLESK